MSTVLAVIGSTLIVLVFVAVLGIAGLAGIIWVMCKVVKGIMLPPENKS